MACMKHDHNHVLTADFFRQVLGEHDCVHGTRKNAALGIQVVPLQSVHKGILKVQAQITALQFQLIVGCPMVSSFHH